MKIAVSMIILNDEDNIGRALASIHWADKLYIVDGGSIDNTVDLIRNECPIPYSLITKPWDNHFGNQRQCANDAIAQDIDWWIRLDSDEEFPIQWEYISQIIPNLSQEIYCVRVRQTNLYPETGYYSARHGGWETHPRLFRNLRLPDDTSAWKWQGQVHEYPELMSKQGLFYPNHKNVINISLPVIHYGWLDKERRADREKLYLEMPGSNFVPGQITNRKHTIRKVPK